MLTGDVQIALDTQTRKAVDQLKVGDRVFMPIRRQAVRIVGMQSYLLRFDNAVYMAHLHPVVVYRPRSENSKEGEGSCIVSPNQKVLTTVKSQVKDRYPRPDCYTARDLISHGSASWVRGNKAITYYSIVTECEGFIDANGVLLQLRGEHESIEYASMALC